MVNVIERLFDVDALVPSAGRVARAIASVRHHDARTATIESPTGFANGSRVDIRSDGFAGVVVAFTPPTTQYCSGDFSLFMDATVSMAGADGMTLTSAVERAGGVFELTFKVSD